MSPENLLKPFLVNWPAFAALLAIFIAVRILTSPVFKGWFGEWIVNRSLRTLEPSQYRDFRDLYIPHPEGIGTTQLDHVVVSTAGIFIIETKNYRGWIFGSEKQREWTQQIYRKKTRFQNPVHQNKLHARALGSFLGLPEDSFHPVVFFVGEAEFKTPMPGNVLTRGLVPWIRNHPQGILPQDCVERVTTALECLDRSTNRRKAAHDHVKALGTRHAAKKSARSRR